MKLKLQDKEEREEIMLFIAGERWFGQDKRINGGQRTEYEKERFFGWF